MRLRIATALLGSSVSIIPLQAATWDYLSMDGVNATAIISDADHARVFVGTIEGFHVYDIGSDLWTEQDEEGWIGRSVHSIAPHELFPGRVLSGRQNAFFKGYIELTNDVSADGAVVYESGAGAVNGLAADHTDANRFYAVTGSDVVPGEFLRSVDGGVSWSLMGNAGQSHMTSVTVALDGTVYVGGDAPVTRSGDGGSTWTALAGGLPGGHGVYDIVANPDVGGAVIAANDAGVFETMDGGTTWTEVFDVATRSLAYSDAFAGVPGEPFVEQLIAAVTWDDRVFLGRRVNGTWDWTDETGDLAPAVPLAVAYSRTDQSWYVATEGSGTYRTGLDVTVGVPSTGIGDSGPALYASPNPFLAQTTVSFETTEAGLVRVDVYDVHGRHVATLMDRVLPPGGHRATWEDMDVPPGVYSVRVQTVEGVSSKRIVRVP